MAKTALITGVSGQDGAYLARGLLARGYRVVGAYRRTSGLNVARLDELGIADDVELIEMELSAGRWRCSSRRDNLAAQSFVDLSLEQPIYTADADALGVLRLLEAMREICPGARPHRRRCSARRKQCCRTKRRRSTRGAPTALPS